jgi:hypothetical protein
MIKISSNIQSTLSKTITIKAPKKCLLVHNYVLVLAGEVTNAKNIKADRPKILRPTHFSCMKDIKAKKLVVGVIP